MKTYAQKNYLQPIGIDPGNGKKRYRIDQVGCLLVAFCNVLEALGQGIDPIGLNANFRDRGIYIDLGDGIRDELGWGSITQANGNIVGVQRGFNSWPQSNDAVVRFEYGNDLVHFSKVADWTQKKILDSWDGVTKLSPYGQPKEWMIYASVVPVAIPAVVPAAPPIPVKPFPAGITYQPIAETILIPKDKPAAIWAMTFTEWKNAQQIGTVQLNEDFKAVGIAKHPLGGEYYMRKGDFGDAATNGGFPTANQGVNVVDMIVKPAPVPDPPLEVVSTPIAVSTEGTATVSASSSTGAVTLTVPPVDKPFNETYEDIDLADYRSKKSQWITDFADPTNTTARVPIRVGNVVPVRGKFYVDGQWYLRSRNSVNNGRWLGLPEADMERVAVPSDEVDDKDIEAIDMSLTDEVKQLPKSTGQWLRNVLVGAIGTVSGIVERIALKNKNKKQETK